MTISTQKSVSLDAHERPPIMTATASAESSKCSKGFNSCTKLPTLTPQTLRWIEDISLQFHISDSYVLP